MRVVKRAVIGTVTAVMTLAALFFGGIGVAALIQGETYAAVFETVTQWLAAL